MLSSVPLFLINGEKFKSDSLKFCMHTTRAIPAETSPSTQELRDISEA